MAASRSNPLAYFDGFDMTVLAIPFVLSFFLVLGIRAASSIPIAMEANWIFRISETVDKKHYALGFKKAIIFSAILPLFIMLWLFYLWLWGWMYALLFCLYGMVLSCLLTEVVFINYRKIPFTCSYLPGKGKLHIYWAIYVISLVFYASVASSIAYGLLLNPSHFVYFYATVFLLLVVIRYIQNRFFKQNIDIIYEEELEPVLLTLVTAK
jgi:hypothetical protein